jgi:hypothetical protein
VWEALLASHLVRCSINSYDVKYLNWAWNWLFCQGCYISNYKIKFGLPFLRAIRKPITILFDFAYCARQQSGREISITRNGYDFFYHVLKPAMSMISRASQGYSVSDSCFWDAVCKTGDYLFKLTWHINKKDKI